MQPWGYCRVALEQAKACGAGVTCLCSIDAAADTRDAVPETRLATRAEIRDLKCDPRHARVRLRSYYPLSPEHLEHVGVTSFIASNLRATTDVLNGSAQFEFVIFFRHLYPPP